MGMHMNNIKLIKTSPYVPTNIVVENISATKARISAHPFEKGYAITLAHPIRRLLLSSSIGYAIIGVKIDGVSHEFDSIRGVNEDVAILLLHLRKVLFKIVDPLQKSATLNFGFKGPKVIIGSDLSTKEVLVLNEDIYVATLNEDANFNFSLIIHQGMGYIPSDEIAQVNNFNNYIPVDAYFSSVSSANYHIENVLVKDDPEYEKIIFEVETNGSISPIDAFRNAISTMYKQMAIFNSEFELLEEETKILPSKANENKVLFQKLDSLELSARCANSLERAGIKYVGELILMSESDLKNIKNLGKKSYDELVERIKELGYEVGEKISNSLRETLIKKFSQLEEKETIQE